jgi:hypothetical protein
MGKTANDRILKALPPGVARIKVLDEHGREKWRTPEDVKDAHTIVLKDDGNPFTMSGQPGRKSKVERLPVSELAGKIMEDKKRCIDEDPLVRTVHHNPESPDVLAAVMKGISEEAASLKFERQEAERQGKDTSQISMRRVNALKAAGDAFLKRMDQVHNGGVDLDSDDFMTVMGFIGTTINETMLATGMRPEEAQALLTRLAAVLNSGEWKAELEQKLRR